MKMIISNNYKYICKCEETNKCKVIWRWNSKTSRSINDIVSRNQKIDYLIVAEDLKSLLEF